jgi:hypothetical protein
VRPIYPHHFCLHAGSTVNANDLSIDPLPVLGGEEADDASDIDGLADTVHWGPGSSVLKQS